MSTRKKRYQIKVKSTVTDPLHQGRVIVTLMVLDERNKEAWDRSYSIIRPLTPLSLEQFVEYAKEIGLEKPVDPLAPLNDAAQKEEWIEVEA